MRHDLNPLEEIEMEKKRTWQPRSAASPRRTLANNVHVHLRQLQRVERVKVRTYAATGTRAAGGGGSRYTRRMQARADGGGRGGKL